MFDKDQVAVSGPGTVVGANVKLTGIIKDANDITIYGQIDGEVISEKNVLVEEKASVKGPVTAKIVTVAGMVNGSINAETRLEVTPTGKITGSIATRDLIIKSGAQFDGKSNMIREKQEEAKKAEKKEEVTEKPSEKKETAEKEEKSSQAEPKYEIE